MTSNHEEELKKFIEKKKPITVTLSNGMKLNGVVEWQDDRFINLISTIECSERNCTISKQFLICFYDHKEGDETSATIEDI